MSCLYIRLFGKLRVHYDEEDPIALDSLRVQELLCYLLLFRDRPHTREKLANMLWTDSSISQSKQYLRQALWQLQATLDLDNRPSNRILVVESEWISTNADADFWLDVAEFEKAYNLSRGTRGRELDAPQAKVLQEAVRLYKGDLLENWYQDWCITEQERFQNMYLDTLQKLTAYCETSQRFEEGLHYGSLILRCDQSREKAHRRMMRLRYLIGDRTGALRQYERCVQILRVEFGVEPSKRTVDLSNMIRADTLVSPALAWPEARSSSQISPKSLSTILHRLSQLRIALKDAQCQLDEDIEGITRLLHSRNQQYTGSP